MANISSYNQLSSWNEDDDLLFVQQPDAPKKAHPSQMKEYILEGLDVASVGGTGKYISAISEADGKISATAETMDEVPTQDSNKPVKSGGVFSAIDDSVSLKSATGNPITLTDAANANAEELSMTIEPVQSGSGDPSPTNVRPISGLTSGVVETTNGEDTNTATITFGQTVYGGSVNFKTGKVTVTHANISSYNGESINEPWISSIDKYVSGATPTTGAQVVYPLTTPTTLTLTPAELELLKGNNTITANGAEISIEYYPDNAIGTLAGRVDTVSEQIATKANIADVNAIKNKDLRISLNDFTNNGARTIYESVLAYINSLPASDKPIRNVSFYLTYIENKMPRDLPAVATMWYYSYGEIIFRHNQYVDATIILYPFSTADDASPLIKHIANGTEGTWHTVLTDKSAVADYTASDITELNQLVTIHDLRIITYGKVVTIGINFTATGDIALYANLLKLPNNIKSYGGGSAIGFITDRTHLSALWVNTSGYVAASSAIPAGTNYQGQIVFIRQ